MEDEAGLRAALRLLAADLGYFKRPTNPAPPPISVPQIVFDYAFASDDEHEPNSDEALLDALSLMAAFEGSSDRVIHRMRPLAIDLFARWLQSSGAWSEEEWETRLAVLAGVGGCLPELWSLINAFILQSPFRSSPLALIPSQELLRTPADRLHRVLLAYLRLIVCDTSIAARNRWPSAALHELCTQHSDRGVRLLAIKILEIQLGWSEVERIRMEKEWVGGMEVDAEVLWGRKLVSAENGHEVQTKMVDGWMMPVLEARRIADFRERYSSLGLDLPFLERLRPVLSPRTVVAGSSLVFRAQPSSSTSASQLIHVETSASEKALGKLVPNLQLGLPVLLTSFPSSGKTHLLQYLSSRLFPSQAPTNRILTIPLADTTIDVKSLIGSYVSSPTRPGTFEWMEGALAKAVRTGRWVVFDDIDRASLEMLVTIAGLTRSLERGRPGRRARLQVPGRAEIEAGDGLALFATRTSREGAATPASFFSHQNLVEIQLESPSDADILAILSARHPELPPSVTSALVGIWQDLRPIARTSGQGKARELGLRDLEKWCARVERDLPPSGSIEALERSGAGPFANTVFQDEVLLEAADVFLASLDTKAASTEKAGRMLSVIARGLGIDLERATALLQTRRPALEIASGARQLLIGRTSTAMAPLQRRALIPSASRPFALTKPSLILLERIAAAAALGEPALLVGETGTGKTTAVQYIATTSQHPLTVLNLSMQTESSDLIGGFKPIDASVTARAIHTRWIQLFVETFSMAKIQNSSYLETASKALSARKWARLAELWAMSARRAVSKLSPRDESENGSNPGSPRKRRKINTKAAKAAVQWQSLVVDISAFDLQHVKMNSKLVFSFIEGPLVNAMRFGGWLLLDEVNLASPETLEAISAILEGPDASLVLTERGDVEPIKRHPDFRLFACMNPATDVGKKDLPPSLRSRFTEIYVPPPDDDREALLAIVAQYLGDAAAGDKSVILDVVEMYSTLKSLSNAKEIVDGSNHAPHYSMRTLARALSFGIETAPHFGLRRGLWEGTLMAFTMSLDTTGSRRAHEVCERYLLTPMRNARAVLAQIPSLPPSADPDDFVRFGPFWLRRGPLPPVLDSRYVITPSVQAKLSDLARVILTHRYPVLIQGPTSAGKTSAVEFLARQTGHRFVRINNHEHTDIQEYLGTYVTDPSTGNLVFQEGLLVTAVRQGHWIVLDELNLAPTDVLEALNRLLDDNRELVIPETQEVIRPHPNFILFATQNPPGLYSGRKVLSRAFRNRFLEVHFDDVPKDELENILCQRCQIAPTYARRIVQVFEELRHRRQASRVFESKQSFATLRDLFRWAERGAVGYQQLAEDGYMLLAERTRHTEDKAVIKQVIEDVMKVAVDERRMYQLFSPGSGSVMDRLSFDTIPESGLVWTRAMQRLFALVTAALVRNEPVLLVGETGCGKTSVCEVVARAFRQRLVGINCHQNMETADLLGSQRPVRNRHERKLKVVASLQRFTAVDTSMSEEELGRVCVELVGRDDVDVVVVRACQQELRRLSGLFEWSNGPLVQAMTGGDLLLLDEVSLADDSVLERLNSVLEPGRTLVLAEKGGNDIDAATIVADPAFHVVATMNPGGDFGKKELSPALRNRFTEIWVPPLDDREDLLQIVDLSLEEESLKPCGPLILEYLEWFGAGVGSSGGMGLRDILAWVRFASLMVRNGRLDVPSAFIHGGQLVIVDGLESLPQVSGMSAETVKILRRDCLAELGRLALQLALSPIDLAHDCSVVITPDEVEVGSFAIPKGSHSCDVSHFRFEAPTTALNAMRVLRGCQLPKAILLEGSPGVGKTSLVSALATIAGHRLQRINLSDQTDLIDLFGSDLPVEGGQPGEFQWRDAAFLDAMQRGDWVLLDEMNLASQTVLEGLNAVLDHRGTVYVPELGRSFERHPNFRIFAAQNPLQQGGGRKGLPKSFLNRFTKVYLQEHTPEDLLLICKDLHPMPVELIERMIAFNEQMRMQTMITRTIGREGSPWEFNLRDLFRWFRLLSRPNGLELSAHPAEYLRTVYLQRFRNDRDREAVINIFETVFGYKIESIRPTPFVTPEWLQIGHAALRRDVLTTIETDIQHHHLDVAESILTSVEMGWLVILAGDSGAGKRELVSAIAQASGRRLTEFAMHPGVDTSEMLGTFEQMDAHQLAEKALPKMHALIGDVAGRQSTSGGHHNVFESAYLAFEAGSSDALDAFVATCRRIISDAPEGVDASEIVAIIDSIAKTARGVAGFAWVDGQLIEAIRSGGWFLISDANLCNASVLDRLNSLCETDGVLVLSEKGSSTGSPEVIKPHPDFRLFMTYDPRHGELSRAMRNRGVELYIEKHPAGRSEKAQPESTAVRVAFEGTKISMLANESILSRLDALAAPTGSMTPSSIANTVASQSRLALPILGRFGDISSCEGTFLFQVASTFLAGISATSRPSDLTGKEKLIDPALNPNISIEHGEFVFRALQALMRNHLRQRELSGWLTTPESSKSVLAVSAAFATRIGSRGKPKAGQGVYALTSAIRTLLEGALRDALASTSVDMPCEPIDFLERLLDFVFQLEERAKSSAFDYSATRMLVTWMESIIRLLPDLAPILDKLAELHQDVTTTRGLGQAEMWAMIRSSSREDIARDLAGRLRGATEGIQDSSMRLSILQAIAAHDGSTSDELVLSRISEDVRVLPHVTAVRAARWRLPAILGILELEALQKDNYTDLQTVQLLLQGPGVDLSSLVSLELYGSGKSRSTSMYFAAVASWLQRLWTAEDAMSGLGGPAALFAPSRLSAVLRVSATSRLPMVEITDSDESLRHMVEVTLKQARTPTDCRGDAARLATTAIAFICNAIGLDVLPASAVGIIVEQLSFASTSSLAALAARYLLDPLRKSIARPDDLSALGGVWLAVSQLLLELYVTDVPIDPAVRRVLLGDVLVDRIHLLEEELLAVEQSEAIMKGVSDSKRRSRLFERIAQLRVEEASLGPSISRSADAARLASLFSEIHSFEQDAFSDSSLLSLRAALQEGRENALDRETAFQVAAAAMIQRLSVRFADLEDLVQPVITALLFARFGFRCLARAAEQIQHSPDALILSGLRFPSTIGISELQDSQTSGVKAAHGSTFIAALAHARETSSAEQRAVHVPRLVECLDSLYQRWSEARSREQQDEQSAESLYRVRKTDIEVLSDEEQEAKELAALFPLYDDPDAAGESAINADSTITREPATFSDKDAAVFHSLIIATFPGNDWDYSRNHLKAVVSDRLAGSFDPRAYGEVLDVNSITFQLRSLHRRRAEIEATTSQPNFYLSPDEAEIRKAQAILVRLTTRLDMLIAEWPEQMVLQHLRDRCERYLELDVRSPVALVLSALEQLLLHTEDWEAYANRENSLKGIQEDLSALIIAWRRLELASWTRLLDDQFEQFVAADVEWTLRLYGAFVHGAAAAENIDQHIESLLPMVTTYLQSSNLGLYGHRVSLLSCLALLTGELSASDGAKARPLSKVSTLLHNVIANAELFSGRIADPLRTQRGIIDKAIKDYVKLASWKDVNVHALKASAQKSHKHLHRNIRKFRDVLRQPILPVLTDITAIVAQELPISASSPSSATFEVLPPSAEAVEARQSAAASLPAPLLRLADTFRKYHAVFVARRPRMRDKTGSDLDTMADEIIESAAGLAKATPGNLTKENAKVVKNLASRKRKAFADLLKTLRAAGFSQNVRADLLAQQQSFVWLAQRPALPSTGLPVDVEVADLSKISSYHCRLNVAMTALRTAFNGHNPDIASQDLQRGIGFTESLYASALRERDRLCNSLSRIAALTGMLFRLKECASVADLCGGSILFDALVQADMWLHRVRDALGETEEAIRHHRELEEKQIAHEDTAFLQSFCIEIGEISTRVSTVCSSARAAQLMLFKPDEALLLDTWWSLQQRLVQALDERCQAGMDFGYLYRPLADMVRSIPRADMPTKEIALSPEAWKESDHLIQSLLVVAQEIATAAEGMTKEDEPLDVPASYAAQQVSFQSLRIGEVLDRLSTFSAVLAEERAQAGRKIDAGRCIARMLPFVEVLAMTCIQGVSNHACTVKSNYKLAYVVARVMLDLAQKGFCKPVEESEASRDGDLGETVNGTGMGAGTGDKNVSGEIDEEGLVEGVQGEQEEEGDAEDKEHKDGEEEAVEMEQDFEGALEDGKEQEEGEEDGEEQDDNEYDDHVGNEDPLDPGAVDEKFWGDEEKPEQDGGEELMDQKAQDAAGESEMSAREKESKHSSKEKDDKELPDGPDEGDTQHDDIEHDDDPEERNGDMPDDPDDPEAQPAGQNQDQVAVPEGDRLDLPEDLELGEEQGSDDDPDDDMTLPDEEPREDGEVGHAAEEDISMASQEDGEEVDEGPVATGVTEDDVLEQEEAPNQNLDLSASNDAQAQDATDTGKGTSTHSQDVQQQAKPEGDAADEPNAREGPQGQPVGEGSSSQQPQHGISADRPEGDGPLDSAGAPMPADKQGPQASRSLGDILKDIRRRRDEILAQQERERPIQDRSDASNEAPGQLEYLKDDQDEDMQALGPAGEEERQKLQDLNIVDEDAMGDDAGDREMEDIDEDDSERSAPPVKSTVSMRPDVPREATGYEKALTRGDIANHQSAEGGADGMDDEINEDGALAEDVAVEFATEDVELTMAESSMIDSGGDGEEVWRTYASATSDLSYALCEQLRLILEPTLATRLQGDFRTGKRLNMRKIIPYIASEYTKDKIWLRRTKPSRREYQVLLSLDDSRSMAESHSISLAYQTLALVAQALNKLEVGQISIAKFGASVDILHPFSDTGFTDADGAKVMRSFKFDQQQTDVAALVDRTLGYLAEARQKKASSSSAPDLWQLQIIISDGVCQDHHRLRTLLRRALEERVMIVFIIVDFLQTSSNANANVHALGTAETASSRPSILSMQTVEYKQLNGEMQLEMTRYLDTFPFEFYVVLRDVEALPGVLADTLRQWMARVSQSQE